MSEKHKPGYLPWDRTGNRLLVKSVLGKNKPSNYQLPHQNFVYGQLTPEDPEHTGKLIYEWKYHQHSKNQNIGKEKDFLKTNKQCVKNLLHTAADFYGFRKTATQFKNVKEGNRIIKLKLPNEDHAYGKPLEYEDPIKLVMANSYGQTDKAARSTFYDNINTIRPHDMKRKLSFHITKNHLLQKQAAIGKADKIQIQRRAHSVGMWKLQQFKNTKAKVDHKMDVNRLKNKQQNNNERPKSEISKK